MSSYWQLLFNNLELQVFEVIVNCGTFEANILCCMYLLSIHGHIKRKEGNVLFNDVLNTFFMVIWHQTYGKGPLR